MARANTSFLEVQADLHVRYLLAIYRGFGTNPGTAFGFWKERVHSAFVYAGDDSEVLQKLARILSGDDGAVLHKIDPGIVECVVSDRLNDFLRRDGGPTSCRVQG